jgi:phosphatidylglycerophosphatase A
MGNGVWFITILKEQPWIGFMAGILLFLLLYLTKKWLIKKLMTDQNVD